MMNLRVEKNERTCCRRVKTCIFVSIQSNFEFLFFSLQQSIYRYAFLQKNYYSYYITVFYSKWLRAGVKFHEHGEQPQYNKMEVLPDTGCKNNFSGWQ